MEINRQALLPKQI